jgi:hypothetical protein
LGKTKRQNILSNVTRLFSQRSTVLFSSFQQWKLLSNRPFSSSPYDKDHEEFLESYYKRLIKSGNANNEKIVLEDADPVSYRGKFYLPDPSLPAKNNIRIASDNEVRNATIFCFGGMYATNPSYHASIIKGLLKLTSCENIKEAHEKGIIPVVFQSPLSRKERYAEVYKYNEDKSYFSPWMVDFAERYIIPRFYLKGWVNRLFSTTDELTDFTYSAGARESRMIENATTFLLRNKYNLSDEKIKGYYNYRKGIDFGYALDIKDNTLPNIRFQRKTVFAYYDVLSLLPKSFIDTFIDSQDIKQRPFKISYEKDRPVPKSNTLLLLGPMTMLKVLEDGKANFWGHSYQHYIQSVINFCPPDLLTFMTNDLYHNHEYKREMITKAQEYHPSR